MATNQTQSHGSGQAAADTHPITERELFIDNKWRKSSSGETISLVNPATEEPFGQAAAASMSDVDDAVHAARAAFDDGEWPRLTLQDRAQALLRLADELEARIEPIAQLVMAETGRPYKDAVSGTVALNTVLRYYASIADDVELSKHRTGRTGVSALIEKVPVGVVAQIVPWNSPIVMTAFNLPAALLSGCTIVLKPSELSPLSAGYIADAALAAGLPAGVLNIIPALPAATDALVRHSGVDKIAFTGSTATGRKIAEAAALTLKHVSLELGGKAAALVLDDAPLDRLIDTLVPAIMFNNGEMCLQPGRLLVPESRKDEIIHAFAEAFAKVVVGPPAAPDTEVGPLISRGQFEHAIELLDQAHSEGARFVIGGGRPEGLDTGYYLAPTIITDVAPESRIATEEIFAPVMIVIPYRDEEEALAIVNATEFGLSDAVYSASSERALALARRMRSGTVNLNNGQYLDVAIPFGGVKQSGYGQELGVEGLEEYYTTQVIYLDAGVFAGLG